MDHWLIIIMDLATVRLKCNAFACLVRYDVWVILKSKGVMGQTTDQFMLCQPAIHLSCHRVYSGTNVQ